MASTYQKSPLRHLQAPVTDGAPEQQKYLLGLPHEGYTNQLLGGIVRGLVLALRLGRRASPSHPTQHPYPEGVLIDTFTTFTGS